MAKENLTEHYKPKPHTYCKIHFKIHPECISCVRGCLTETQHAALVAFVAAVELRERYKNEAQRAKKAGDRKAASRAWAIFYNADRKTYTNARDELIRAFLEWLPDDVVARK